MKKPKYYYKQVGIIPMKESEGKIKVFLITNRKGTKWILPKGIKEPDKTYMQIAEQEAFEEAGIKGKIFPKIIETYLHKKWKGICRVDFYIMKVNEVYCVYPENFRRRKLVSISKAEKFLKNKKLFNIILKAQKPVKIKTP